MTTRSATAPAGPSRSLVGRIVLAWVAAWLAGSVLLALARPASPGAQAFLLGASALLPAALAVVTLSIDAVERSLLVPLTAALPPELVRQTAHLVSGPEADTAAVVVAALSGVLLAAFGALACVVARRAWEHPEPRAASAGQEVA